MSAKPRVPFYYWPFWMVLLAQAYSVQGNEAKSRETYRRIVTEFPDSPFALEAQRRVGPA